MNRTNATTSFHEMLLPANARARLMKRTLAAAVLSAASLLGNAAQAATDTWVGNTNASWATGSNWSPSAVPSNGDTLVFGVQGSAGVALTDNTGTLTVGNTNTDGIDFNLNAAAYSVANSTSTLTLASTGSGIGIKDLSLNAELIAVPLTLLSTQTINVGSIDGALTLSGVISGGAGIGITKTGGGLLTLSGANAFGTSASPGTITVKGGILGVSNDNQLGTVPTAATAGEIVLDGGTLRTTSGITINANRGIALGDSGVGTGGTIDTAGQNSTYGGIIANNGGTNSLTKVGSGALTLFGANTYTGNTVITQGQLTLDFNQATTATTSIINSSSALVMGGSSNYTPGALNQAFPALFVQGSVTSGPQTQTFHGLTLNNATSEIAARGLGTNNATIGLGAITHNAGGSVAFSVDTNGGTGVGQFTTSTANAVSTDGTSTPTGILGGWAVINPTLTNNTTFQVPTDYAANDGSGNIVAYTGYTALTTGATITSNTLANYQVTSTAAVALSTANGATTDINTLSINKASTGFNTTVTVGTAGTGSTGILRLGAQGGFLIGTTTNGNGNSGANGTINQLIIGNVAGNGTLTAGGAVNTAGTINLQLDQTLTINSNIADNGSGAVTLVVNNYSTPNSNTALYLYGAGSYSGGTYINSGRVNATTATALGTGAVYIGSMAQLDPFASGTTTNNIFIVGNANSTFDTPSAIRGGGTLTGTITLLGDAVLVASNTTYSGQITGNYNLNFGRVPGGNGAAGGTAIISNASNNWGGNTVINEGTLQLGASNVIPDGANAGNVILGASNSNATLDLHGFNDTINGLTGTATMGQTTVKNGTTGNSVLTVGANNQTSTYNGLITDSGAAASLGITKTGTGLLLLGDVANTYVGGTIVNGGTLRLGAASGVTNSTIGAITGALTVNTGGTLDMNGFSQTVGSLSGTGGIITSNAAGTPTLTVNNNTATTKTFGGSIQNGAATSIALVLASTTNAAAVLDLTGANTYTGGTTINGTLELGNGGSLANPAGLSFGSSTASLALGDAGGANSLTLTQAITGATGTNTIVNGSTGANSTLTLNSAGVQTYANVFGGGSTGTSTSQNLNLIIAAGTGTTPTSILSGTSTYIGTTTVNSGATLNLTGSLGATAVTVNSGGFLTGVGTGVVGSGLIGGTLNAAGGSTINLAAGTGQLNVTGAMSLGTAGAYNSSDYTTLNFTLGSSNAVEALNTASALTANNVFVNITNPTLTGTFTLENYGSLTALSAGTINGFSLSSTTAGVLSQPVGRNTETLTVAGGTLTLVIGGTPTPGLAYFDGAVSNVWNDVTSSTVVNFSSNVAGTIDAGNIPGGVTDVILNANNAATTRTETLGASTGINSLRVNSNGTTTLGNPGDSTILTINAAADSNIVSDGTFVTGSQTAGVGIVIASSANAFIINVPVVLGTTFNQTWTNNSANPFTVAGTVTGTASKASTLNLVNTGAGGTTLSGVIANGAGGTLALVVNNTGAGVTTLSNTGNSYTGGTTLNDGTLTSIVSGGFSTGSVTVNPTHTTSAAADNATLNTTGSIASTAAVTVNSEASDGGFGIGTINFNGSTPTIGSLSGNGSVVLNNTGGTTLTIGSTNNLSATFSGVISQGTGTGNLIKAGTGTETLSGANTYQGTTTVNAGTLNLSGTNTYAGITTINSGGTLQLGSSTSLPTNTLAGGANLVINTGGTFDLNNFNTTLGAVPTGTGGTITNASATAGTSTLTFSNGGGGTLSQTLTDSGATNGQLKLALSTGTLTIANANTYTGGTSVATGATLIDGSTANTGFGSNVAASTVTVASGGVAQLNVTGNSNYNYTFAGSGTAKFNFTGGGGDTTIASTAFNGFTGTVELANPGNTGNKLQIVGVTGVSGATLQIDSGATAFVANGTTNFGAITLSGTGNSEGLGAIRIQAAVLGGNITMLTSSTIGDGGGTITGNLASGATSGTQTLTFVNGASANAVTMSGNISNGGTGGTVALTENHNTGITTLSGSNSYTGATTITNGTIKAGSTGAFSSTSGVVFANIATANLDTTGFNTTVGSLSGGGTTGGNITLGAATLTTGGDSTSTSYAGIISGTGGGLTKIGTGTQVLTGANTYTGTTTVTAGTLQIGNGTTGTLGATAVTVGVNGTLAFDEATGSTYSSTISDSGLVAGAEGTGVTNTLSGVISGSGGFSQLGTGTTILTASNTYSGPTTVTAGELDLNAASNAISSNLVVNGGTAVELASNQINDANTLAVSSGTFILGTSSDTVAGVQITGGAITGTTGVLTSTTAYDLRGGSVSAILGGTVGANKTTTGTVTLTGANTFTGTTSITAGAIDYHSSAAFAQTSAINVSGTGAVYLDGGITGGTQALTLSGSGPNGASPGIAALESVTGANSYTGTITLAGNAAIAADGGASLTLGNITNSSTATLSLLGSGTGTISGVISDGAGVTSLTQGNTGTWVLGGANTFTGGTTTGAGTIQLNNINALQNSTVALNGIVNGLTFNNTASGGSTYNLGALSGGANESLADIGNNAVSLVAGQNGSSTSYSGVLSGSGGLTEVGAGILTLSGNNTYSGATAISGGGTIQDGVTDALPTATVVTEGSASESGKTNTLDLNGNSQTIAALNSTNDANNTNVVTDNDFLFENPSTLTITGAGGHNGNYGGTIQDGSAQTSLTVTGGTQTLSGVNTYTGATTLTGGTLNVTGSIANSAVSVGGGATLAGTGSTGGVTMSTGGSAINLTTNSAIGTLTVASLTTAAGDTFSFEIGGATTATDKIVDTGLLTINGITTINIANLGGSSQTLASGNYELLSYGSGTTTTADYNLATLTLDGATLSLTQGQAGEAANAIYLTVSGASTDTGTDYFNGTSGNLNVAATYDTGLNTGTATTDNPSATSNLYFSATRNTTQTTGTVTSNLEVNSLNFGVGGTSTGTFTVAGTNTLTIDATASNNTAGNGINIAAGGSSATISDAVALGNDQTWTSTDAGSKLLVNGVVSGAHKLSIAGNGSVILGAANTYSGGTEVTSGTLFAKGGTTTRNGSGFVTGTSGSATGTGSVLVDSGAKLSGAGVIAPTSGTGVTVATGGTLVSGIFPSTGTVAGNGLTLDNSANLSKILTVQDNATLSFYLGSGATADSFDFAHPATQSSFLTVLGNTAGEIQFGTNDTINLVDLTGGQLQLLSSTAYLLIQAGGGDALSDNNLYAGLTTSGGVIGTAIQNGWVTNLNLTGLSGVTYPNERLYLYDGDLEVVPEPSTWALMIGGLAVLVVWQRRRSKKLI
jgi:fibronectin-binding autotransporter adhesin